MSESDLDAYLSRIGRPPSSPASVAALTALHRAHVHAIPFENLEIQMGGAILLDAATLQDKLVRRRRGGYCFEQNTLLLLALRALGYAPQAREARVRQGANGVVRPRTHMVLTLECEGHEWLVDVGFGADGLVEPVRLDGAEGEQAGVVYRVAPEAALRVLQRRTASGWEDLYSIEPGIPDAIDFEVGNWYTSTHPRSGFVLRLTAQRVVGSERHVLRNLTHTIARGAAVESRDIDRSALVPLLRDVFGIDVPEDSQFRAVDSA